MRVSIIFVSFVFIFSCAESDSNNLDAQGADFEVDPTEIESSFGDVKRDSSPAQVYEPGRLTSGVIYDFLNLENFVSFYEASQLSSLKVPSLEQLNWLKAAKDRPRKKFQKLQMSLVIDVTGSMYDELSYLQGEFKDIVGQVVGRNPGIEVEINAIVYRDQGDDFVTRQIPFTKNIDSFMEFLAKQNPDGGGDYPEAMDSALAVATNSNWGGAQVAKILFLVADAPPHEQNLEITFSKVLGLRELGVSIYPIAASGVGDMAEEVMRSSALLTGGEYIFLTDDSGIGNPHAEPRVSCYQVELLKDTLLRVIDNHVNGEQAFAEEPLREEGRMKNGVCLDQKTSEKD